MRKITDKDKIHSIVSETNAVLGDIISINRIRYWDDDGFNHEGCVHKVEIQKYVQDIEEESKEVQIIQKFEQVEDGVILEDYRTYDDGEMVYDTYDSFDFVVDVFDESEFIEFCADTALSNPPGEVDGLRIHNVF